MKKSFALKRSDSSRAIPQRGDAQAMANYEMRKFVVPEFIFGAGARHRVGDYARHFSARRILIVSDPGVIAAGWLKEVQDDLAQAGVPWVVFQALTPNPKDHEVMAGALVYGREHCDVIRSEEPRVGKECRSRVWPYP